MVCLFVYLLVLFSSSLVLRTVVLKIHMISINDYSRIQYTSDAKCVVSFSVSSFSFFGNLNSSFLISVDHSFVL